MKKKIDISGIIFLVAVLLLGFLFLFPIWSISLWAPQYPDGIGLYIWINQVTGDTDSALQNINILNHYIGMQPIHPDSIKELTYFPYIIIFMIIFGMVGVIKNNFSLKLTWLIVLIVLGTLGIYDFYIWLYDFGHNLSPTAPIKIPGMVYQPPLFGEKILLNIKATSYPATGGILLGVSIILTIVSLYLHRKKS